jgi:hypothetical protein
MHNLMGTGSLKIPVVVLIKGAFKMDLDMAKVGWSLKVERGMKERFKRIRSQVEVYTSMRMELDTKAILRMENVVVMESCNIQIRMSIEVIGRTICGMEWVHFTNKRY